MASIFSFFKRGLEKSATKISRAISGVFTGIKAHGDSSFEDLEAMLVAADFGLKAATEVTACLKDRYERGEIATDADLVEAAKQEVTAILKQHAREINLAPQGSPTVILFVGVNGSGKTTTIGKLATRLHKDGKKVILATSKPEHFAKQILDYFDLTKYFDLVAGATMDYSRAKKGQVIAYALENFGVTDTSECIMVGDRDQDVIGAREQGFDCIGVLYGYGGREELEGAGVKYIAETVEDILKFI